VILIFDLGLIPDPQISLQRFPDLAVVAAREDDQKGVKEEGSVYVEAVFQIRVEEKAPPIPQQVTNNDINHICHSPGWGGADFTTPASRVLNIVSQAQLR
jgi:hypothetical protein